ncbi:MAG: hypothetical protein ABIH39_08590 [Candidatus Margulisiibacteriota bacterium]
MAELEGFDYSESVYEDDYELRSIFNDSCTSGDHVSMKINSWLAQMPRW